VLHFFVLPGMTIDDPAAFAPPPAFGPFRVLHQIGIGALGPVFRTYEPTRDRLVAVKVFRLDITPEQAHVLADELARASDAGLFHPSIVEPVAAGVEGTVAYRAEEYVAAESLDAAIRHYAPAPLDKALPFLTQLAGAVDFARIAGIGHGALHLRDVFVTPDEARASGFGVVEALERVGLRAPVRRPYSAPERIAGEPWGTPADVFSLAAITYELLTGRRPSGTGDQIGPLTGEHLAEFGPRMRTVLARAMAEDPAARYPTALAFASALEAAARGGRVTEAVNTVGAIAGDAARGTTAPSPEPLENEPAPAFPAGNRLVAAESSDIVDDLLLAAAAQTDELMPDRDTDFPHERDDAAHYELTRGHEEEPEPSLFDDEAAADVGMEPHPEARPSRTPSRLWTDDSAPAYQAFEPPGRVDSVPVAASAHHESAPYHFDEPGGTAVARTYVASEAERPRPAVLPVAVTLVLGLLIGFAAGYWAGGREPAGRTQTTAVAPATPAQATPKPPEPADGGTSAAPAASDQAAAKPPTTPPGVPDESSATARDRKAPAAAAAPAPASGRMVVTSTPARASVTVNGRWRGRTPLTLDRMTFGPYNLRVVLPGYTVAREDVTLSPSDPSRTVNLRLQREAAAAPKAGDRAAPKVADRPAPGRSAAGATTKPASKGGLEGTVYVDSRPRGARILIDGNYVGTTPARVPDVSIGSHVVRLELTDHRPWTASTRVSAGEETRVTGSLERIQ
jgi:hypothetical protein